MSDRLRQLQELSHHELAKKCLGHELAQAMREEAARRGRRRTDPPGEGHMHERRTEDVAMREGREAEEPAAARGAPWWIHSAWVLGPVAIIAVVLAIGPTVRTWIAGPDAGGNEAVLRKLEHHSQQTDKTIQILEVLTKQQQDNGVIQRRICRNTAKSETAKEDCDR